MPRLASPCVLLLLGLAACGGPDEEAAPATKNPAEQAFGALERAGEVAGAVRDRMERDQEWIDGAPTPASSAEPPPD